MCFHSFRLSLRSKITFFQVSLHLSLLHYNCIVRIRPEAGTGGVLNLSTEIEQWVIVYYQ